ncbi:unnamed protein product, partial [Didymodactylos carnosus]
KVIVCGAKTKEDVNPGLIYIADKTQGSIHTMKEDILSVAGQFPRGKTVKIGSDIYKLGSRGFKKVETLNEDEDGQSDSDTSENTNSATDNDANDDDDEDDSETDVDSITTSDTDDDDDYY